ncbi:predicted protein [Nematostella vectensis]|uniref:Sugar phosphate phosphatase n=1 Tax=Nematostella vectensis TaxID=45351 RepID=A7RWT7_NEMVE|nr:predicted protein [Nematostella vectensis]|eukprot:XP_001636146.1 predicted protein [Nematostella vectensis]
MFPERPEPSSGKDEGSFAYLSIRDRMPVILTKVIDSIHRRASQFVKDNNLEMSEDAKLVVSKLSKLRYEMKTGKKLTEIEGNAADASLWNSALKSAKSLVENAEPAWFTVPWLTCECFLYRKIYEAFSLSKHHQEFDPFHEQKECAFTTLTQAMASLAHHVVDRIENANQNEEVSLRLHFDTLLQFCLWGNKCDLSISSGEILSGQTDKLASRIHHMKERILVDNSDEVWTQLQDKSNGRVDFIMDNAGFEFFTDLCLAEFLVHTNLASVIYLHVKEIPWFVSDTTPHDVLWTLNQLKNSAEPALSSLGKKWSQRIEDGTFIIRQHQFWSLPNDYSDMKSLASDLYQDLSNSKLVIFKGDLNYRKLVGDRKWKPTVPYREALWGFCPAPLCALRTLKCECIVGLSEGQAERIAANEKDWMINASYAVLQYAQ